MKRLRIACLHTADSNIVVFEAAALELGRVDLTLRHVVRADLLAAAEAAGGVTEAITVQTRAALAALRPDADAVLLNCSTLGAAADAMADEAGVPIMRVDRALAEAALREGGKIVVLCTTPTTVGPTTALFDNVAGARGVAVEVRLVAGAWALFRGGDQAGYFAAIVRAAENAYADGAQVVALAQASMVGAAALVRTGRKPLSSPLAGLRAAVAAVDSVRST